MAFVKNTDNRAAAKTNSESGSVLFTNFQFLFRVRKNAGFCLIRLQIRGNFW